MLSRRSYKGLALLIAAALLLTGLVGCGPDEEETPPEAPTAVEEGEPTEAPTEEPEPSPEERENTVTIVIPEDPPHFNGSIVDTGYEKMVGELVMLGLAELDPTGEPYPELAAELPTIENGGVVVDEEAWTMEVTWNLRDDVYWEDGEPVTADDVVFTWEAITDPEMGTWVPGLDYLESVEKVDDYTVLMRYNGVYPGYLYQFGGWYGAIWPEHYCDADQGFSSWDCNREPLSNGPFLLEEWVSGDHLTFVRNPDYFEEEKPYLDKIIIRIVPDSAVRRTLMIERDADIDIWLDETSLQEFDDIPHVGIDYSPTSRWLLRLLPNQAEKGYIDPEEHPHPFLSDVRVRQAIRYAIDAQTISEEIFRGLLVPAWSELRREPYNCEDDIPQPGYRPDEARALLEEAGWTDEDGDGIRECHGCPNAEEGYVMSMEFLIYAEWGESLELTQQLIAENLEDVGIDTELGKVQGSLLWNTYDSGGLEQTGNFELNLWDDGYVGEPTDYLWSYYHSDAMEPDYGWNVVRWSNEEFDTLLDETYTVDEEYRQELFCDIAEILDEELPHIPILTAIDATAYSKQLEGVSGTINDMITWNAADWQIVEE